MQLGDEAEGELIQIFNEAVSGGSLKAPLTKDPLAWRAATVWCWRVKALVLLGSSILATRCTGINWRFLLIRQPRPSHCHIAGASLRVTP